MSSSTETSESKLNALQCHFTWDLQPSRSKLTWIRDALEDISNEEGNVSEDGNISEEENVWLGHICNLLGFIQYQLGSSEEALNLFNRAAETFQRQKNAEKGPWLTVNFGNLAWLHHHLGEDERSEDYLSKIDDLMREYPPSSLHPEVCAEKAWTLMHPEVCAEKAWTLMKFDREKKLEAEALFQRAIQLQPDSVEWQSSYTILSTEFLIKHQSILEPEVFERLRSAKERDPGNLYVAALYLEARAANREQVQGEARVLAGEVLERPMNSYCGFVPLLRLYRKYISKDEAIAIAKEALTRHPNSRYTIKCAAICYMKKIFSPGQEPKPSHTMINRGIRLWNEMIAAYNDSSLKQQITLAELYAKREHTTTPDQIYSEQLQRVDVVPAEKQMLYSRYAKYLFFSKGEIRESTVYHMRAAEIQVESKYQRRSIGELEKTLKRNRNPELIGEIRNLLTNLRIQPEAQNQ